MSAKKIVAIGAVLVIGILTLAGIQVAQAADNETAPASNVTMQETCTGSNMDSMHGDHEDVRKHYEEDSGMDHGDMGGDMNAHHSRMHGQ